MTDSRPEVGKGGALVPSSKVAEEIVRVFPLARFSAAVEAALGEDRDTVTTQHFHCIFQLRAMRALYGLLQAEVPGLVLAFPMFFVQEQDGTEVTYWVGEYDPYNLMNVQALHAVTRYRKTHEEGRATIELRWNDGSWRDVIPDLRARLTLFTRVVSPAVFNEVFRAFFRTQRITESCLNHDAEEQHPASCERCGGKGIVLIHDTLKEKFSPASWLSLILDLPGWCEERSV